MIRVLILIFRHIECLFVAFVDDMIILPSQLLYGCAGSGGRNEVSEMAVSRR